MTTSAVQGVDGAGVFAVLFQIFNLVLLLGGLALAVCAAVLLIKVLFKLNKALDIWLKRNETAGRDD